VYLVWLAPAPPQSTFGTRWRLCGAAAANAATSAKIGDDFRFQHRQLLHTDQPDDQAQIDADEQQAQRSLVHPSGF